MPGEFPTNRIAKCREIDGGDDEALLAGEVAVGRFRELRCRREVDEPISPVDRGALKSARVGQATFDEQNRAWSIALS